MSWKLCKKRRKDVVKNQSRCQAKADIEIPKKRSVYQKRMIMIMKEKNNGKELIKSKESKIKESGESNDNK